MINNLHAYDPFATSYGKMIYDESKVTALRKFMVEQGYRELPYEYNLGNEVKLVLITGATDVETKLKSWNHPLVFEDLYHSPVIALDLRKYVNGSKFEHTIADMARDASAIEALILRAKVISDFMCGDISMYKSMLKSPMAAYAMFIGNMINNITILSPVEKLNTEIVSAIVFQLMVMGNTSSSIEEVILAKMTDMRLSVPVSKKNILDILNICQFEGEPNLDMLVNAIISVLPEAKQQMINKDALILSMSNLWFEPGNTEYVVMAIENAPCWVALSYSALSNRNFKRARLSTILDKFSKQIDKDNFIKQMDTVTRDLIIK